MRNTSCIIPNGYLDGKENTPAHCLVRMGHDAVPQLAEALGDKRFTRAVEYHRNFYSSHRVLTVGECAETILAKITGLAFDEPVYARDAKGKGVPRQELVKAEVRAWYVELQRKGERLLLMEAAARGDDNSSEQGKRLLRRYPKDALAPLIAGAESAKSGPVRATLVSLAGSIKGNDALQFLLAELKEGPLAEARLAAARSLHERGRPEGLAAMIAWWNGPRSSPPKGAGDHEDPAEWAETIARFLAECGEVEAINALAKDLRKKPIDLRLEVLSSLAHQRGPAKQAARVEAAVEALLIAALDDTEERTGMSGIWNGKYFSDPRMCDVAGHVLSELDPKRYPFDLAAPLAVRNRRLVELKNVWRQANNLAPVAVPQPRKIAAVPAERLRPLLDKFLAGPAEQRAKAQAAIEGFGLGALLGVLQRQDDTERKEEQALLDGLAKRLSCVIADIELGDMSLKPDAALVKRLEALKGKPFDPKTFIQTIGATVKGLPPGAHGLGIFAHRPGDGTGFSLRLDLLSAARAGQVTRVVQNLVKPVEPKGPPPWLSYTERVKVGPDHVHGVSGGGRTSTWTNGSDPELEGVLDRALAALPGVPIEIRIRLIAEWRE
jgi:hypothetical protein